MKTTDIMYVFNDKVYEFLLKKDLSKYDAVISFSPFHSVNILLECLKKVRKFKWIAHFCDPWFMNPLETSFFKKKVSYFFEKKVVKSCDYLINTCEASLNFMLNHRKETKSSILPHIFLKTLSGISPVFSAL